jgi:hypothetical protein
LLEKLKALCGREVGDFVHYLASFSMVIDWIAGLIQAGI